MMIDLRRAASWAALTIAVGLGGWIVALAHESHRQQNVVMQPADPTEPAMAMRLTGLVYRFYDKNEVATLLEADVLSVHPRRFWAFNINSVYEATFTNARVRVYRKQEDLNSGHAAALKVFPFFEEGELLTLFPSQRMELVRDPDYLLHCKLAPSLSGGLSSRSTTCLTMDSETSSGTPVTASESGFVTRGVFEGLTLEVFLDQRFSMQLMARRAELQTRDRKIRFFGMVMKDAGSDRILRANTAFWDEARQVFEIPAGYVSESSRGKKVGQAMLEVGLQSGLRGLS